MEWDFEKCLFLIEMYKSRPELWQTDHKSYYDRRHKEDLWTEIASEMDSSGDAVKLKMNSLLASFRREKSRQKSGDRVYRSKWFAYQAFDFLKDRNKCCKILSTDQEDEEDFTFLQGDCKLEPEIDHPDQLRDVEASPSPDEDLDIAPPSSRHHRFVKTTKTATKKRRKKSSSGNKSLSGGPPTTTTKSSRTSDPRVDHAFVGLLKRFTERDPCDVYGEHVANKLRCYDSRTQAVIQHAVNGILFKADMGEYDN